MRRDDEENVRRSLGKASAMGGRHFNLDGLGTIRRNPIARRWKLRIGLILMGAPEMTRFQNCQMSEVSEAGSEIAWSSWRRPIRRAAAACCTPPNRTRFARPSSMANCPSTVGGRLSSEFFAKPSSLEPADFAGYDFSRRFPSCLAHFASDVANSLRTHRTDRAGASPATDVQPISEESA